MSVSIVIPIYQGAVFISDTIESVLDQTFKDWILILVDDGSSDLSYDIAKTFASKDPRIRAFKKENGGVASARNYGYRQCSATNDYLVFLDHDDVWHPEFLQRLVCVLDENPAAVAAHALAQETDLSGKPSGRIFNNIRRKIVNGQIVICERAEPTTFDVLICECAMLTPGTVVIRRSALDAIRYESDICFDSSMGSGDDWDLWLRMSLLGNFIFIDEILMDWRLHEANNSKNDIAAVEAEFRVRKKMTTLKQLSEPQRKIATWRYMRAYCSAVRRSARACSRSAYTAMTKKDLSCLLGCAARSVYLLIYYFSLRMFWRMYNSLPTVPLIFGSYRQWE